MQRVAQYTRAPLWAAAAFAAACVVAAGLSGTAEARVVKRLDYESGSFSQWAAKQALAGGTRIVSRPRTQGRYAAKFRVGAGDDPIGASGERAEVMAQTGERAGSESWWKWSTLFPRKFRPTGGNWNVFTQWHHTGSACQPPIGFVVDAYRKPARILLQVNSGSLSGCTPSTSKNWSLGRLKRGRWQTFVFHVRWSPKAGRGFVEVWRNGRKVLHRKRVPTLYFGQDVYVKQGYYRSPASWTTSVYHDGLRRFNRRPYRFR